MREFISIVEDAAREQRDEEISVINAYLKKKRIGPNDLAQMNDEQIEAIKADALANQHLYPIARTEPEYLYHGTAKARLPMIRREGLKPSEKSRWMRSGLGYHSLGRVFFTDKVGRAEFYARSASRTQWVLLRVRRENLLDVLPDSKEEEGCFYVEHVVPPDQIEVWNGSKWVGL